MATMGRTARSLDRRDRAAELPDGSVTLLQRPDTEPRTPTPSLWLPSAVAAPRSVPAHFSAAVAAEVIPRLRLAHAAPVVEMPAETVPDAADVEALSTLLVRHDVAGARAYVETLGQAGTAMEQIFLDLLAPSARLLGAWWASDRCDFATVTLGTMHLRRMQHDLAPRLVAGGEARLRSEAHKVLMVPLPGEQHVFGLDMVASFFRRAGWQAHVSPLRSVEELCVLVRRESYAVVGISTSATDRMDTLATAIRKLRRASRNRSVGVMVGGPAFAEHPEYVALVGADATATDARQAPVQAERLLRLLAQGD